MTNSTPYSMDGTPAESLSPKILRFEELAHCGSEVWIESNGSLYRLRRTKQGKLILTK
ncbi:MAG: hemin uptake protein HemP [Planctomycetota bacterium]